MNKPKLFIPIFAVIIAGTAIFGSILVILFRPPTPTPEPSLPTQTPLPAQLSAKFSSQGSTISVGSAHQISLDLLDTTPDITAAEIAVQYDPTYIEVIGGHLVGWDNPVEVINRVDPQAGIARFVFVRSPNSQSETTPALATLEIRPTGIPGTSSLSLRPESHVTILNNNEQLVPITANDIQLTVK